MRLSELFALERRRHGRSRCAAEPMPERHRGNADAPAGELTDRDAEAGCSRRRAWRRWETRQPSKITGLVDSTPAGPSCARPGPTADAGVVGFDEEAGDALAGLRQLRVGYRPYHEEAGIFGTRDPHLGAVDAPSRSPSRTARVLTRGRVGAGTRIPTDRTSRMRNSPLHSWRNETLCFCASVPIDCNRPRRPGC